jgi:hypothetical protein
MDRDILGCQKMHGIGFFDKSELEFLFHSLLPVVFSRVMAFFSPLSEVGPRNFMQNCNRNASDDVEARIGAVLEIS